MIRPLVASALLALLATVAPVVPGAVHASGPCPYEPCDYTPVTMSGPTRVEEGERARFDYTWTPYNPSAPDAAPRRTVVLKVKRLSGAGKHGVVLTASKRARLEGAFRIRALRPGTYRATIVYRKRPEEPSWTRGRATTVFKVVRG
ncbi:MAG: hypothetical protein CMH83_18325 [Nocardioides sp.]|nr:hypothetical protein [Nocardioides sp.]